MQPPLETVQPHQVLSDYREEHKDCKFSLKSMVFLKYIYLESNTPLTQTEVDDHAAVLIRACNNPAIAPYLRNEKTLISTEIEPDLAALLHQCWSNGISIYVGSGYRDWW